MGSTVLLEGSFVKRSTAGGAVKPTMNDGAALWVCPGPPAGSIDVRHTDSSPFGPADRVDGDRGRLMPTFAWILLPTFPAPRSGSPGPAPAAPAVHPALGASSIRARCDASRRRRARHATQRPHGLVHLTASVKLPCSKLGLTPTTWIGSALVSKEPDQMRTGSSPSISVHAASASACPR